MIFLHNVFIDTKIGKLDDSKYELKTSTNGKFFFNIKATNGQVVRTSALFATETERDAAKKYFKAKANKAKVEEI